MEKAADSIQSLLKEKLACYQQFHLVLKAEKKAIGTIDLGMIWETTRAKKDLVKKIEVLRKKIVSVCQDHFPDMERKSETFTLSTIVNALPLPSESKNDIRYLKHAINKEKDMVAHFTRLNELQVKKNMAVVDDIMALIANNASQARYTGRGMMTREKKSNCLFKVAG
ncbi:flagellar export chaperone FlgN [uncultured Desulfobacter sp.]|uniref:flagellar export chaperone FlgN n=1 Tax=uncultured Desulfobacter sp. TaxID=240139 RepID=UPI002AAA69B2|nr:flagellar export chaperone FlgN [uncultured Desulfobacter sp.]